ncbi:MAG: U32 family peptidase [Oscillospiraceae bacterium]|jgi:putative protease|nr:U32 family peptidase [Oscillospiraceae bacterium]
MGKPELLSPAGDRERLDMALAYGADAVYLAGNAYGMRAFAGNFGREGLAEAVKAAHAQGVRVHVTCNTLARNGEIAALPEYLEFLDGIGADAVIAAGVDVLSLCKRHAPHVQVHMSTQTGITNYEMARVWRELGASRVILARELSLEEVAEICAKAPRGLEVECFVHGAMCVSYSGRCLLSNYMTGRDAARGACAQPCRYRYSLVEEKRPGEYFPIIQEGGETFILNSRDMCMIDHIPELIQAGVHSLKIEGRAKSAYYAAMTTAAYRHAVDAAAAGRPLDPVWRAEVDKVSHRHYSTGFWFGQPGQYTQDARYIRDWQVLAIVKECGGDGNALLSLRNKFAAGDALEVVGPDLPAFPMTAPMMEGLDGQPLAEPRHPQMEFRMKLPRAVPPLSLVRANRPSS